ncbi:hypothetical protein BJ508DRAFT_218330 [Ascobolus immersus RN42]|uniref:Uncharacterized protein n=1 Tax=Ascobolus immersus RN42 TaxID=1160509 RepID=A0A3N4H900_ASCIM|nr:hypothetical protein BJ508DRAFT_218330 [Ascobolus immersus RN42]
MPEAAMCIQKSDNSLKSAIHTTYRISLRSSSMRHKPRDPLLIVLTIIFFSDKTINYIFYNTPER